ncbi:MAG: TldD/PmbA family protein [Chloroflexi bacterium]|nr:TldD/PmbA family protein [Chloroflexota bacterium]MCY3696348.1 TldD/PmbA family protein [Chloroflexota bacterium]
MAAPTFSTEPLELASRILAMAEAAGADQADAVAVSSTNASTTVRLQKLEKVSESTARSVGLRVILGGRQATVSTSDVSDAALNEAVRTAMELAQISEHDPFAGLADPGTQARSEPQLALFDEQIPELDGDHRLQQAMVCEQSALDADARISNSGGATFSTSVSSFALVDTNGFSGTYADTSASMWVEVMAQEEDGQMRNAGWSTSERSLHRLDDAAEVGREAAARALRQLGAAKASTCEVPVVWEPRMAAGLAGIVSGAASGEALYRRATFLAEREQEEIASPLLTIVDDGTLSGRLGSRPFDGEGVATRRNALIESGVFQGFLFDSYNARRLDATSTGSAWRSVGGLPQIGSGNLSIEAGETAPERIIGDVEDGLYLTTLMGFGVNYTTGDFSRGAAGIWIRNGELAEPVQEINVSGNLLEMLERIDAVGSDAQWFGSTSSPTLRMSRMTVSGA